MIVITLSMNLNADLYACIFFTPDAYHRFQIVLLPSLDNHHKPYYRMLQKDSCVLVYHSLVRLCTHLCGEHNIFGSDQN